MGGDPAGAVSYQKPDVARPLPVAGQSVTACVRRGEKTGERGKCLTCKGDKYTDLFACSLHGTCHRDSLNVPGVRACRSCPDRQSGAVPPALDDARPTLLPRRNLLFHMHPVAGSNWRWHAEQLRKRLPLFDGKVVVAVTTGPTLDSPEEVSGELGDRSGVEIIPVPNAPKLREVATFLPLFERLTADPNEVTLYGQSKGVTYRNNPTVRRWAGVLWEVCCDHWPHALDLLRKHPVVGPFLYPGRAWPEHSMSEWHFSGSWFWFRNADLLGRPGWRRIDRFSHGIEPYPSLHFTLDRAGELFHRVGVAGLDLYSPDHWRAVIEPALLRWRQARLAEAVT